MYIKNGVHKNTIQNMFLLRTLSGKSVDPSSDCSTNLRLDQDIVKLFKADFRLKMSGKCLE